MRQGGEPQGVQVVRQGEPTPLCVAAPFCQTLFPPLPLDSEAA
nr:hypothetical protein [uncultured Kingella sp.]